MSSGGQTTSCVGAERRGGRRGQGPTNGTAGTRSPFPAPCAGRHWGAQIFSWKSRGFLAAASQLGDGAWQGGSYAGTLCRSAHAPRVCARSSRCVTADQPLPGTRVPVIALGTASPWSCTGGLAGGGRGGVRALWRSRGGSGSSCRSPFPESGARHPTPALSAWCHWALAAPLVAARVRPSPTGCEGREKGLTAHS